MATTQLLAISLVTIFAGAGAQITFRNPILDSATPEPSIIKHQDFYYMTYSQYNRIELLKSPTLSNFRNAERREIYQRPTPNHVIWAPEIQSIRGELYIYFTMRGSQDPGEDRMHVIKSLDSRDPLGLWSNETRLMPDEEIASFEGTVLQYNNGDLYLIFSAYPGEEDKSRFNLYIARMESPISVLPPRTLLKTPSMDWETNRQSAILAPSIVQRNGRTFLVFSASSLVSPDYCLGIMGIDGGRDPMIPNNWWDDVHHCVFARNDVEKVWATGQPSFVTSPDDSETWLVYEARDHSRGEASNRTVRIDKIGWSMNNPIFPHASGTNRDLTVPSGEKLEEDHDDEETTTEGVTTPVVIA